MIYIYNNQLCPIPGILPEIPDDEDKDEDEE